MATPPQPSQPSQALAPPPRSNTLGIVLLIVGMIVLLSGIAVWGGIRFLTHSLQIHVSNEGDSRKQVSIKTPFGSIEANKNGGVTESSLQLPIYPGSRQAKDEDSASVTLGFPGSTGLRIVAGKFDTPDPFAKVRDFYEDRLTATSGPFTRTDHIDSNTDFHSGTNGNFVGVDDDGKTVFKMKLKDDLRIVTLKENDGATRIELVRVGKGSGEPN
ncbi:MAG TPA: hypothetical protein VG860_20815 [Terriglobia bacterium]|jgi:hypothetical protein|nr:hypothetical protein [Terriglobia bacterium]